MTMRATRSDMSKAVWKSDAGFTLIELIVVAAIISILVVAFSASFFGWRERYNAESDVKSLYAALLDSKLGAMKERRYFFVNMPLADSHLVRIYKDTDPPPMGNGILDITKDQQVGPDIVMNNEIDIMAKYRNVWFNGQGMLWHPNMDANDERDFQIRFKVWDTDNPEMYISTQSDYNCLLLTPPFYFNGGIWNATAKQEKDDPIKYQNLAFSEVTYANGKSSLVTPGLDYKLCQVK